jgi:Asp-tRNA(Asn)/Glu-tRNA(Gln) amidotransferase A subunit family amidase
MPVGLQLVGKHFRDPELLQLAATVENASDFTAEPSFQTVAAG